MDAMLTARRRQSPKMASPKDLSFSADNIGTVEYTSLFGSSAWVLLHWCS
jgi:hypothetical protein